MALYDTLQTDFEACDARGKLIQLARSGYQQVNVLYSKKGAVRGGHYHKVSKEAFFVVSGSVEVALQKGLERETVVFHENDFFLIRPNVSHAMTFKEACILLALYDVPVERGNGEMDIYREEMQA